MRYGGSHDEDTSPQNLDHCASFRDVADGSFDVNQVERNFKGSMDGFASLQIEAALPEYVLA